MAARHTVWPCILYCASPTNNGIVSGFMYPFLSAFSSPYRCSLFFLFGCSVSYYTCSLFSLEITIDARSTVSRSSLVQQTTTDRVYSVPAVSSMSMRIYKLSGASRSGASSKSPHLDASSSWRQSLDHSKARRQLKIRLERTAT